MSVGLTLLVLGAALMHAAWNAMIKSGGDKTLDTVLISTGAAAIAGVALMFIPLPARASWPWLAASIVIHILYFAALIGAYRAGDLSQAYTLMRGSAPMLVALFGSLVLGEQLNQSTWAGVLLISLGVIASGWVRGKRTPAARRALWWAIGNAFIIMSYTLVDGAGVRLSGNAASYTLWIFFLVAMPMIAAVSMRNAHAAATYARRYWPRALVGGFFQLGAYGIVLWAMTRAPVAAVSALRETAVIFAAVIGVVSLKERFGAWRIGAAAVVAFGIVLLRH